MSTGLLGFESVQQRQGGVWEYISPSRLGCWLSCPLKWKFRYLDGIKTPTTPSLFVGKVVHAGLEVFNRHRHLGITLEAEEVTQRMLGSWAQLVDEEKMSFESTDAEQTLRRQATDLVNGTTRCPKPGGREHPPIYPDGPGDNKHPPKEFSWRSSAPDDRRKT
jgi:putative RecB family exonuclease